MRLIPGKTKVKIELFKGVTLADVIVMLVGLGIGALCAVSSLPHRWIIAIVVIGIFAMQLVRINDEPMYILFWHMLRYQALPRRFYRVYDDKALVRMSRKDKSESRKESMEAFYEEKEAEEEEAVDLAEEKKKLKAILKEENNILKSKTATKEEKDAVWMARAKRSAEKKKKKATGKAADSSYEEVKDFIPFTGIKDDFIEYAEDYVGAVIEIDPVEFRFFSQHRRDNSIESCFGRILRSMTGDFGVNIVKLQRPILYDRYLEAEYRKLGNLKKSYESGLITEEELKARVEIEYERISEIDDLCTDNRVIESYFYIVLYDKDRRKLNSLMNQALEALEQGEIHARRLDSRGLAIFLKYSNELDFEEDQIDEIDPEHWVDWAMPEWLRFTSRRIEVNQMITHNMRVISFPSTVGDAWLAGVMSFPGTKVMVKCTPMDRAKSIRAIDRSLAELRGRYNATGIDSKRLELQAHIETLSSLLITLQSENEALLSVNIYVTAYDALQTKEDPLLNENFKTRCPLIPEMKKTVRHTWAEAGMKLSGMDFLQVQAFIGSQVSAYDPMIKESRGIPSNTIAGMYPWIFAHISDEGGVKLGSSDGVPVFIDFFRRDSERVNSNMVIVGKSGSGKSYTTKSLLLNLASEDSKIFILDPENEYSELAHNLHGKIINVGNATFGRLNPFHIITALDDDEAGEGGGGPAGSFATHLQFLEEFFRQILPDIDRDALEYLNSLVERMYLNFGITPETDLSRFHAEDYPVFDDLYDVVLAEFERTNNDYLRQLLRSLVNYISKFSTGGRNANIWNGPSTITTDENFSVFNFQSLLANRNSTIANAQMLLVLKYIDNEIIKNRDYNLKYKLNRKVVVVIDEAHVFIDSKFPVALDFMFQLAKRIRKYNGMQIVITQNIKDFVGSEEIARKSTAIINACQYSFVFGLAPNDMDDLCRLYEKAGGINEQEQEDILNARRGQAFAIMSPSSRSSFQVEVPQLFVNMFEKMDFESVYFSGEEGEAAWEDFIMDSRDSHDENYDERLVYEAEHPGVDEKKSSSINFSEISDGEGADSEADTTEDPATIRESAVNKLIAAEENVNRREYELATGRFGGIRFTEETEEESSKNLSSRQAAPDEEQEDQKTSVGLSFGSIQLEELDGSDLPESTGSEETDLSESAPRSFGSLNLTEISGDEADRQKEAELRRIPERKASDDRATGYRGAGMRDYPDTAAFSSGATDRRVYNEEQLEQRLNEFRQSIRAEVEQELLDKLKWISIGAGLAGGNLSFQEPGSGAAARNKALRRRKPADEDSEEIATSYMDDGLDPEMYEDMDHDLASDLGEDEGFDDDLGEAYGTDLGEDLEEDFGSDLDEDLGEEFEEDLGEAYGTDLGEDLEEDFGSDLDEDLGEEFEEDLGEAYGTDLGEDLGEDFESDLDDDLGEDLREEFESDLGGDLREAPRDDFEDDLDEDFDDDSDEGTPMHTDFNFELDDDSDLDESDDEDYDFDQEDSEYDEIDIDDELLRDDLDDDLTAALESDLDEEYDDDEDFEHTPFLFAELLAEAAEEYSNKDLDERMEESGELVAEITLDDLNNYIRDRLKKKRGA